MISANEYADVGLELLVKLTTANENYLYMSSPNGKYECKVWNGAAKNALTGKKDYQAQVRDVTNSLGVENLSTTKRYADVIGNPITGLSPIIPPTGTDGMVVISKNAKFLDSKNKDARSAIIFHELWENYERTTNKKPYRVPQYGSNGYVIMKNLIEPKWDPNNNDGAHNRSSKAENRFHKRSSSPGMATYLKK